MPDGTTLSIVAPVHNEEQTIETFIQRCIRAGQQADVVTFELILVNDGSRDGSADAIQREIGRHPGCVKRVDLARNFGQQSAFHAGLSVARGDLVVTLDSDLQDPPEIIPALVKKARDGADIVYARRAGSEGGSWGASGHTGLKSLGAYVFHRLVSRVKSNPLPRDVGEYRCMRRDIVDRLLAFPETMVFLPGLVAYLGYDVDFVPYVRERRQHGTATSMRRLVGRALDALTTFSIAPLVLVSIAASLAWLVPVVIAGWLLGDALTQRRWPSLGGMAWLGAAIAWCVTLSMLAIIAHYLGRIFIEAKRRPRYLIKRVVGGDDGRV